MAEKLAALKRDPGVVMAFVMGALSLIPFIGIIATLAKA